MKKRKINNNDITRADEAIDRDSALFERRQTDDRQPARLKDAQRADVAEAVRVLKSGGVILYPTDTVWGLGCDATNAEAVRRIYSIKQRDDHKALITLVESLARLERTVSGIPDAAYDLIEFADRPVTIVYDHGTGVSDILKGDDDTLAVRVTVEAISSAICRGLGRPLVSTSANISGQPTPKTFSAINPEVIAAADYVCLSRRDDTAQALPSMVVRMKENGEFNILRK